MRTQMRLSYGYMCNSCMQFLQRCARIAGNSKVVHARIAYVTTALSPNPLLVPVPLLNNINNVLLDAEHKDIYLSVMQYSQNGCLKRQPPTN